VSHEVTREQFKAADGVAEWRMMYDGPTAFFRTRSMAEGAALASTIGALDGMAGIDAAVDLRADGVTVRLSWYSGMTEQHVWLAQRISAAAHEAGAEPDASRLQVVQVTIDALSIPEVVAFWRAVLDYHEIGDDDLIDPRGRGPMVWFQDMDTPRRQRNRVHVDISLPLAEADARVKAALAAGGTLVSDAHAPMWWTLADPEGNEVDIAAHPDLA
jgi:4a-hydroxytetrahydrobiopterin dehydratase